MTTFDDRTPEEIEREEVDAYWEELGNYGGKCRGEAYDTRKDPIFKEGTPERAAHLEYVENWFRRIRSEPSWDGVSK